MSSDDGNDYHKSHQQQSITPTPSSVSSSSGVNTNTIRRKSLTQAHFPHQLQTQSININCNNVSNSSKDRERDRIEIVERGCSDVGTITSGGYNGGASASPSRYIQQDDGYHTLNGRISACQSERYEENITCCLPPPSPAPTSDRFVIGN